MALTVAQLHEIRAIIEAHHTAFVVNSIGVDAVAPEVLEKLKALGLVNVQINSVEEAYLYGQAIAAATDPKVPKMSYEDFKDWLKQHPIPLSDTERRAVDFSKQQAAQYVVGLGNKVNTQTGQIMIEADAALRAKTRKTIRDETAENIATRETVKKLKSNLGWSAKDWARDWDRIAITEKHTAMQRGTADHYAGLYGDDARVAKRPTPDACKHCKRLHLGPDGHPRIFKLSTLEANGLNNFGRKAADWLPVVGSTHPYCQCTLVRVPAGWGFDEKGSLVPGGEGGVFYEDGDDLSKALYYEGILQKAFALQGHVDFQGLDVRIENKVGSVRRWTDENGIEGETTMLNAYGYVAGTQGADGDEIDVYIGPDPRAQMVYVIHQKDPKGAGRYDEDKVMLGFVSEEHARHTYLQHYDRPGFYVTCSPMSIDHFKRWIRHTDEAAPFMKAGQLVERLVIPLEKADPLQTVSGQQLNTLSAQVSRAGSRSPGPGTMVNYMANVQPRESPTVSEEMRNAHREFLLDADFKNKKVTRDKEDMVFDNPADRRNYRYEAVLPDVWGERPEGEEVEANREVAETTQLKGSSKGLENRVEMTDERVQKSSALYIGPKGGKWANPQHTIPYGKTKKKPPKKSHIVKGDMKRQGEVHIVQKKDMTPPNVYEGFVQRGHDITLHMEGKTPKSGKLVGYSPEGRPVVNVGGKQRTRYWPMVKTADEAQSYKPVYDHLTRDDALINANARQRTLVKDVLQLEVGKGKAAQAYMDWLRNRGNEVFLVGGIVRDLVAGTAPKSKATDTEVKEVMKDIDIVSTAHPQIAVQMAKDVGGTQVNDNSVWGVAQILDGVGLDVCSIASKDGDNFTEGLGVYDHDLEDDVHRRDFTANAMFYDVYNNVIIDPTGKGFADAQARVLRLAPSPKEAAKNDTLPMRFWKFRARGWRTEAKTLAYMKAALPKMKEKDIRKELKKIVNKGPKHPKAIWNQLKSAMIEDGAYDLYKKFISPHKHKVMK